jgi:hypothetical protein
MLLCVDKGGNAKNRYWDRLLKIVYRANAPSLMLIFSDVEMVNEIRNVKNTFGLSSP